MQFQYKIIDLMFCTIWLSCYLTLRATGLLNETSEIRWASVGLSIVTCCYVYCFRKNQPYRRLVNIAISSALGAMSAGFVSILSGIELGEHVRRSTNGQYWNWYRDWPILATAVAGNATLGLIFGLFCICVVVAVRRFFRKDLLPARRPYSDSRDAEETDQK